MFLIKFSSIHTRRETPISHMWYVQEFFLEERDQLNNRLAQVQDEHYVFLNSFLNTMSIRVKMIFPLMLNVRVMHVVVSIWLFFCVSNSIGQVRKRVAESWTRSREKLFFNTQTIVLVMIFLLDITREICVCVCVCLFDKYMQYNIHGTDIKNVTATIIICLKRWTRKFLLESCITIDMMYH